VHTTPPGRKTAAGPHFLIKHLQGFFKGFFSQNRPFRFSHNIGNGRDKKPAIFLNMRNPAKTGGAPQTPERQA